MYRVDTPNPIFFMSLIEKVYDELKKGELIDFVQAKKEQALAAQKHGERRFFGDLGEVKHQIHQKFYHYWGQRLGYECWDNPEFVREFLRDNESARVRSHSNKIQVGYGSLDKSSTFWRPPIYGTKFHKSYGSSNK